MPKTMPATFKQYRLPKVSNGHSSLIAHDKPIPEPQYGEVLIKVHAVSLNYRDLLILKGHYPLPLTDEFVPCSDCAGEIVEVGPGVSNWQKGDRVMPNFTRDHITGSPTPAAMLTAHGGAIDGFLAEYAIVAAKCLVRLPDDWSYEQGATLACAAVTAYNALMGLVPLKGGDTVVIQGTGGVSIFGLQIAVASGARVIVTSSSDEKLKIAKKLGAHDLINYKTTPDWDKEVLKLTNGEGADFIVEVGGPGTLQKSFQCVKFSGTISTIGFVASEGDPGNTAMLALQRAVIFRGILIGSVEQFEAMVKLFTVTGVKPVVDKVFPFTQIKEAYDYLESQKHVGKVVIKISS